MLAYAGVGRPEDLVGVVLEIGEDALVLALEAGPFRFAFVAAVAWVEDSKIAHLNDVIDEFLAELAVGRAEEVLILEAELMLHADHCGGGEAVHTQTLQRLEYGPALGRRQIAQHIVIIHHLSQAYASHDIVAEHVCKAENGVEAGIWIDESLSFPERGVFLEPTLHAGIQEGIGELCRMEMHLDGHIVENVDFALLVEDIMHLVFGCKCPDGVASWAFDPQVDIAALAAFRVGVEVRKPCALQDAALQAALLQDAFEFCNALLMVAMHLSDLAGDAVPFFQDMVRWKLMLW